MVMELEEVVLKLIGPTQHIGDSAIDAQRLINLEVLCDLTTSLALKIRQEYEGNFRAYEASRMKAKAVCANALDVLHDI